MSPKWVNTLILSTFVISLFFVVLIPGCIGETVGNIIFEQQISHGPVRQVYESFISIRDDVAVIKDILKNQDSYPGLVTLTKDQSD